MLIRSIMSLKQYKPCKVLQLCTEKVDFPDCEKAKRIKAHWAVWYAIRCQGLDQKGKSFANQASLQVMLTKRRLDRYQPIRWIQPTEVDVWQLAGVFLITRKSFRLPVSGVKYEAAVQSRNLSLHAALEGYSPSLCRYEITFLFHIEIWKSHSPVQQVHHWSYVLETNIFIW